MPVLTPELLLLVSSESVRGIGVDHATQNLVDTTLIMICFMRDTLQCGSTLGLNNKGMESDLSDLRIVWLPARYFASFMNYFTAIY
jgi:hypothetical protein